MDRVKAQAAVVSQLLFSPKTADAYRNVLVLTGQIFKEVALLAWLLICSVFVFAAWFGDFSINTGKTARTWWEKQQTASADGNETAAATGKAILDVSQNSANFLLDKAREQLGLETLERPAPKANSKKVAVSKAAAAPAEQAKATAPSSKPAAEKVATDTKTVADSKDAKDTSATSKA
ncbi:MAG: hypothetical protein AAF821_02460 [Cyanobacteria bacterium P01_D01_bin.156]